METKTCSKCHIEKPFAEFTKTDNYCRPCRREISREYAKKHPERMVQNTIRWIKKHRDKFNAYRRELCSRPHVKKLRAKQQKRWYESEMGKAWNAKRNKERTEQRRATRPQKLPKVPKPIKPKKIPLTPEQKIEKRRAYARRHYEKRKEHFRKKLRESYKKHKETRKLEQSHIRAKRANAVGTHTIAEWKCILRHYKRRCVYCGIKLTSQNISRDHKIPLARGGTNCIRNIVPACLPCNQSKHTQTYDEFINITRQYMDVEPANGNASVLM